MRLRAVGAGMDIRQIWLQTSGGLIAECYPCIKGAIVDLAQRRQERTFLDIFRARAWPVYRTRRGGDVWPKLTVAGPKGAQNGLRFDGRVRTVFRIQFLHYSTHMDFDGAFAHTEFIGYDFI